ncbi:polyprenol phosphomannose-dependent alpha 1,6 mannosyltransferase MptB [Micrococcus sp.]|uniref:polyprenol phosphomannose-dependent alpha 1,6 mannosyltransferase MptB n=1 Tax=Micrococcus sp. TaxID=1271 RepID=UPI002A9114B4|nr:polyprenol phosphomannose-dependent alpha 1,6 mannosyltransferase MptB [Micrococcus sp.]MDY6054390.1 polyprenol phosphomannose-dependent alpha 1,6 mannosyltransferase MptB [Micrococcus sp.]
MSVPHPEPTRPQDEAAPAVPAGSRPIDSPPPADAPGRRTLPLRLVLTGVLGSLLVTVCSYGVGWIAPASPLQRWPWLAAWRTHEAAILAAVAGLAVGLWLMLWAWLRVYRRVDLRGDAAVGSLARASVWWALPQLLALPILSRDMFAYLAQGRMMVAGRNPYEDAIADVPNWLQLGADSMWAYDGTPYGPAFLWIEEVVVRALGVDLPALAIGVFRLVAVAGLVLTAVFVPLIARRAGLPAAFALWLTVLNPLMIVHFVASGHNDSLMVGLALAGTWCAMRAGGVDRSRPRPSAGAPASGAPHPDDGAAPTDDGAAPTDSAAVRHGLGVLAAMLLALSVAIKPITLVLLPFVGLLWAGSQAGWLRRFVFWAATAVVSLGTLAAVGAATGVGFGWLRVIAGTGTGSSPWSPVGLASTLVTAVLQGAEEAADADAVLATLKVVGRLASIVLVLVLMFVGRQDRVLPRMAWAFAAVVVLSPVIHAWYLLWLLPFFAAAVVRRAWHLGWVVFTVCFFLAFGAQDQIFTWDFLHLGETVRLVSLLTSAVCLAVIFLVDRRTRGFLGALVPLSAPVPRGQTDPAVEAHARTDRSAP